MAETLGQGFAITGGRADDWLAEFSREFQEVQALRVLGAITQNDYDAWLWDFELRMREAGKARAA